MVEEVKRILVADAAEEMRAVISYNLEAAGFVVECVGRGDDAEAHIAAAVPDLLILELILPGVSGLELCRRLRSNDETLTLPIIVISELNEEHHRAGALTIGADDYLGKPFSLAELTARVLALLRRSAFRQLSDRLVIGDIALNLSTRRVSRYGRAIHIGPLEYALLSCLMHRPGQVFSRAQLLEAIWPAGIGPSTRTVDVHIARLRKALSYDAERDPILTVRGEGYAFDESFDQG